MTLYNNNNNENNNDNNYESRIIDIKMVEEDDNDNNTNNINDNPGDNIRERRDALLSKIKICKQLNKDIKCFNRVKEEIENDIDNTISFLNHFRKIRQNNIIIKKAIAEKRLTLANQIIRLDDISSAIDANLIGYEIEKRRIVDELKKLNFLTDIVEEENSFLFDDDIQFTNNDKVDYWKYYRSNYDDDSDDNSGKPGIIDFR